MQWPGARKRQHCPTVDRCWWKTSALYALPPGGVLTPPAKRKYWPRRKPGEGLGLRPLTRRRRRRRGKQRRRRSGRRKQRRRRRPTSEPARVRVGCCSTAAPQRLLRPCEGNGQKQGKKAAAVEPPSLPPKKSTNTEKHNKQEQNKHRKNKTTKTTQKQQNT